MESESDKIEGALKEFEGDDIDELRLMRIKFIRSSELEKEVH
jgi:ATP-dependent DNA helicase RecQ